MLESLIQIDKNILVYLNNLGSEQWDPLWLGITKQFYWTPLFVFILYLIFKTYGWKKGGFLLLSLVVLVAFSDQFVNLIKDSVGRLRPNNDLEISHLLRTLINPQSKSFISGHATTSTFFAVYISLIFKSRYKKIFLIVLFPLLFGYSRIYLGVHFPLDILCGYIVGSILAYLYFKLIQFMETKWFTTIEFR